MLSFCFFVFTAHADDAEKSVRTFIQNKYFNSKKTSLLLDWDKGIPMTHARLYRVRELSGKRGFTVLVNDKGIVIEVNKTDLHSFLESIKSGLVKMNFLKNGESEAKSISYHLLNHFGTYNRKIECESKEDRSLCQLYFVEGPLKDERLKLLFDFKDQFILVKH